MGKWDDLAPHRGSNAGHQTGLWSLEAKVDWLGILADDDTRAGVVFPSEEEIVGGIRHCNRCEMVRGGRMYSTRP